MKKTSLLVLLALTLFIAGCSASPQYIPENLEDHPANKVSVLTIDLRLKFMKIDERIVKRAETLLQPKPIFLTPGKHLIVYQVYGETDRWRAFYDTMIKSGYKLSADGKYFSKKIEGLTVKRSAAAVSRYGWNRREKEILLEVGKRYKLSDFYSTKSMPTQ